MFNLHPNKSFWVFNRLMLIGAVLGFFMGGAALDLVDAVRHHGSGTIVYHDDQSGRDYPEKVPEGQFKRNKYSEYGLILVVGALIWVEVARRAKNKGDRGDSTETDTE